jgi:hypothetical protein
MGESWQPVPKSVHDWVPAPGSVVSWHASPKSRAKAQAAPVSTVPASYMQAQHLRGYYRYAAQGRDYSRLPISSWDIPGQCDIRAMTYVINAHLRRHETYRSWFECKDGEPIVRRTMPNPTDIKFVPVEYGELSPEDFRNHLLATPDPSEWDCFTFGLIQRADHFTFYVCVDHLHTDVTFMGVVFMEIHAMYHTLVSGGAPLQLPPAGSYDDFCLRQQKYTSGLTLDSPEVKAWVEFAENSGGTLPEFPLPLGDPSVPCNGDLITVQLMDADQADRFELACVDGGARFSGGVFAAAALAEYELTGAETFYRTTPTDSRSTPEEFLTTGWFTGMAPLAVSVDPTSFGETARSAQSSFDVGLELADVPFDRVRELAPWLRKPNGSPMISFLDAGVPPLSSVVCHQLSTMNAAVYFDGRSPAYICMWVNRLADATSITVFFPGNPVARDSVERYLAALKAVFVRVADGRPAVTRRRDLEPRLDYVPTRQFARHG